jgi:pimeloyl-ACP methyl ester carboxylesterase
VNPGQPGPWVHEEGHGPTILFVHGSAADHTTWGIQVMGLRARFRLITWDRIGTGKSETLLGQREFLTVEAHAADAARIIEERAASGPVVGCGSSFGGVVVLELARTRPELLRGAVLLEPPLAASDDAPPQPMGFLDRFDSIGRAEGGPAAAEFFLRQVLGGAAYERIPRRFQDRSKALHRAIRQDIAALGIYRPRYSELHRVKTSTLLLGGERSASWYRPTLEMLQRSLGNATLEILPGAGHMMHADVHRRFNERLATFMSTLPATPPGSVPSRAPS